MTEKEYPNIVIAGVWPTKGGHFNTLPIDARTVEALQNVGPGGKFFIRKRSEKSVAESRNPSSAPLYYLEYVPKSAVDEYNASKGVQTPQGL